MDKIAKFSRCMKELLISKRKLFGELYYITSQTTEDTRLFIDKLLQTIVDVFEKCNIPIGILEDRQKENGKSISTKQIVVLCYNYFLLNTRFPSQRFLHMDFLYGHKVNMWPNISPYLFIQIIWRLEYEEVLVESLQHIPLDLCAEILDITIKCLVDLESKRAISLIFSLISRIYCKCLWLKWNVCLKKNNAKERLYQLVAYFQMLLDLFDKFNQKISDKEKYKHRGTVLKRILRYTRLCMCKKLSSNLITPDVTYIADMYRLTFGNLEIYYKFTNYDINSTMIMLDQELVTLLQKEIQKIDYLEYIYWAEIEDEEDAKISLQHAIAIECHKFMEYMKKDDFLVENDYLRQLLQQFIHWSNFFSPENSKKCSLTLRQLCASIVNGKTKNMRKLMKRYKEWDNLTINFISDRMYLLEKDDIFFLLEYLHHVFANSLNATERNHAYVLVLTMLEQVNNINLYLNVLRYTMQHFQDNYLECMYDDEMFHNFIKNEINIQDPLTLRVLLIYILLNAKRVLTILIKIVIDYNGYKNFTFTEYDLLTLHPFLCLVKIDDERYNLLLIILKEVCFNNDQWDASKFYNLVVLMEEQVITTDDLINYFYIPYLTTNIDDIEYLEYLEICLQHIVNGLPFARKINYVLLIVVLTKRMSLIRRNTDYTKEEINKVLFIACHILYKIRKDFKTRIKKMARKLREYNCTIGNWLEPLDRAKILMIIAPDANNVLQVLQNYETRCFPIHQRIRTNQIWGHNRRFTYCARINRESFMRHMMLHATTSEFMLHVYDLTKLYLNFGWISQLEAYENLVRIATEAIQLAIVYSKAFPYNASITLLHTLVEFCKKFARNSNVHSYEAICHILLQAFLSLKKVMNGTQYSKLYNYILIHMSDMFAVKSYTNIKRYFRGIKKCMQVCFGLHYNHKTIFFEERYGRFEKNFSMQPKTSITSNGIFEQYINRVPQIV